MAVRAEVYNKADGFRFRLIDGNEATQWAQYTQAPLLNGVVGATEYFTGGNHKFPVDNGIALLTTDQFCDLITIGKENFNATPV